MIASGGRFLIILGIVLVAQIAVIIHLGLELSDTEQELEKINQRIDEMAIDQGDFVSMSHEDLETLKASSSTIGGDDAKRIDSLERKIAKLSSEFESINAEILEGGLDMVIERKLGAKMIEARGATRKALHLKTTIDELGIQLNLNSTQKQELTTLVKSSQKAILGLASVSPRKHPELVREINEINKSEGDFNEKWYDVLKRIHDEMPTGSQESDWATTLINAEDDFGRLLTADQIQRLQELKIDLFDIKSD